MADLAEVIPVSPIQAEASVRRNDVRCLTSCKAGKIVPLAYAPLLREDRVSRGSLRIRVDMAETAETLMNGINVTAYAHFVPFLAFERFEGSLDRLNRSYQGVPDKTGGAVVPFFQTVPYSYTSEIFSVMGIHAPAGKQVNSSVIEAYNAVVNFRRKARSQKLEERTALDQTLAQAFWKHSSLYNIVPDFDQAAIDGEVELILSGKAPVSGIGTNSAFTTGPVGPVRESTGLSVSYPTYEGGAEIKMLGGADGFPAVFAELAGKGVKLSLSNIEMAKQTAAFAALRKRYSGVDDEAIIDLLMAAIRVPDAMMAQPMLLDRKSTLVGFTKRHATDGGSLDKSVTTGETYLELTMRTPPMNTGGIVLVTLEIVPEQLFERMEDHFLTATTTGVLPSFTRDYLDPEKVAVVPNSHVDVLHASPMGTFGYAPLNYEWQRNLAMIGGKFMRMPGDPFDEDRQRIWSVETLNPALTADFYLVNALHHKVFADQVADAFEITSLGGWEIVGNTVFGKRLYEDTGDFAALIADVDTGRIVQA